MAWQNRRPIDLTLGCWGVVACPQVVSTRFDPASIWGESPSTLYGYHRTHTPYAPFVIRISSPRASAKHCVSPYAHSSFALISSGFIPDSFLIHS